MGLKKILYGMPGDDFPFEKYIVGGCIMSEADVGCTQCDWSGMWDQFSDLGELDDHVLDTSGDEEEQSAQQVAAAIRDDRFRLFAQ